MREKALVSIIIPSFNRAQLIGNTVHSVLAQSYGNWELIIVDDGSSDNTFEVIKQFAENYPNIKVFRRAGIKKGGNVCRNQGLSQAQGEYVMFLDSDDLMHPELLAQRVSEALTHPENDCWIFNSIVFDLDRKQNIKLYHYNHLITDEADLQRCFKLDNPWNTTSMFWKTGSLKALGAWDENLLDMQDYDLILRLLTSELSYYKSSFTADYYIRGNVSERESVNANVFSEKRIESKKYFFKKWEMLYDKSTDKKHLKKQLAGTIYRFALKMVYANEPSEKISTFFAQCKQLKLVSFVTYWACQFHLHSLVLTRSTDKKQVSLLNRLFSKLLSPAYRAVPESYKSKSNTFISNVNDASHLSYHTSALQKILNI